MLITVLTIYENMPMIEEVRINPQSESEKKSILRDMNAVELSKETIEICLKAGVLDIRGD